ncbi:hypothetical protein Hanom_Chr16g01455481 [Helianthus anomalus]
MKSGKKDLDPYTIKGTNKVVRRSDLFVRLDGYKRTNGGHLCCTKNRGLGFGKKKCFFLFFKASDPLTSTHITFDFGSFGVLHHLLIVEKVLFKVLGVLANEFYKFWGFCAGRGGISGSFGLGFMEQKGTWLISTAFTQVHSTS